MNAFLVAVTWEKVLASGVIGLGAALIAAGGMAVLHTRPPAAVEAEAPPPDSPRLPRLSKPVAWLIILAGLCMAAGGFFWRTSLVS